MARTMPDDSKRLLLVLEATIGGTRRHLRDLALGMAGMGWNVHVAYANRRDPDFVRDIELFRENGIECTEIDMRRSLAPLSDVVAIWRLRGLIRRFRPSVVHLHSTKAGLVGRLAALGTGARVIYSPHCFAFNMTSPFRFLYRLMEMSMVRLADGLVAVCEDEARCARELGYPENRIHLVYNGIDLADARLQGKEPMQGKTIVFVCRSSRQKGLDILAAAFEIVRMRHPDAKLLVMSDVSGRIRARLESLGAEILPFGTERDACAYMARASILVMPSRWEAFPYTMLEALAMGVPVVAANVGGVGECISDGTNGLLVPPGIPSLFACAIDRLLSDSDLKDRITANASASVSRFGIGKMLDDIVAAYKE